jgi:hypothetical protein
MSYYEDEFPWLSWEEVSEMVDRKSYISEALRRFLQVYSVVNDPDEMYDIPVDEDSKRTESWGQRRDNTIARLLPRYLNNPTEEGLLTLELWAYDPGVYP